MTHREFDFFSFWLPSILMGVGIAIDVAMATVSKFRDRTMSFQNWTLPIMGTHILFPAFGYYGFWGLRKEFSILTPVLGGVGFLFVFLFVYEVVCEAIGKEPVFGISSWFSDLMGLKEDDTRRIIAILAVSWDALWSGPAKAAQAVVGNWTTSEVMLSFPVAGVTVALVAELSLAVARSLQRKKFDSVETLAQWFFWGKYVELSVIGGFGVLSLLQVFGTGNIYVGGFIAGFILRSVWVKFAREIELSSLDEAEEAIPEEE
jgi:hypothetical protein